MRFVPLRTAPRPRHVVSPWLLVVLTPCFRYSAVRDAWILRGIGELRGPVLVTSSTEPWISNGVDRRRWRPGQPVSTPHGGRPFADVLSNFRPALAAALAVTGLVAAALGFAVAGSSGHGHGHELPRLDVHASQGLLRMSFPSGWRPRALRSGLPQQLPLTDEIAFGPSRPGGAMLIVGRASALDPQLLPPSLLLLLRPLPVPQTVTLGKAEFFRYQNLSPRGQPHLGSVYAMSTTGGIVLGICLYQRASSGFQGSCERSLATVRLLGASALPPGPIPGYAAALNLAITQLNGARAVLGQRLLHASAGHAQARAAYALADAHAQAAAALTHLNAGPAGAANTAVVSALRLTEAAYRALGQAAAHNNSAGYQRARATLQTATSASSAAYEHLRAFGYIPR